jgi:hypothetical protein
VKKIIFIAAMFLCVCISQAQSFSKVKVTLNNGLILKGSKALIGNETISFVMQGSQKTYPLSDVRLVMAREGKAGKWALGCGGGCLALCVISGIASGSEGIEEAGGDVGTYILGSILWTGIFAGVGAIIGSASDRYETVYISNNTSWINKFDIKLGSNQYSRYNRSKANLTLRYKF